MAKNRHYPLHFIVDTSIFLHDDVLPQNFVQECKVSIPRVVHRELTFIADASHLGRYREKVVRKAQQSLETVGACMVFCSRGKQQWWDIEGSLHVPELMRFSKKFLDASHIRGGLFKQKSLSHNDKVILARAYLTQRRCANKNEKAVLATRDRLLQKAARQLGISVINSIKQLPQQNIAA